MPTIRATAALADDLTAGYDGRRAGQDRQFHLRANACILCELPAKNHRLRHLQA